MSQSFADLGVSQPVVAALGRRGITEPFAIQSLVLPDLLDGRDVLAKSPTGSGKTLAFGIPLVERIDPSSKGPSALILAPTRELATQIVDELRFVAKARNLRVQAVYGGVGLQQQGRDAARAHIVVATPGRLEDQLARRAFSLDKVKILVLDEADRMLDMGFRPAIDRIVGLVPQRRQTLFFSATLDGEAGRVAHSYTQDAETHEHRPTERSSAEIEHRFRAVERDDRVAALVEELRADRELALVFVRTKRGADRLVKKLGNAGVTAVAMHGDKSQRQREQALARFESGKVDCLVATDVAARGIDVAGISHVINFDPPEDREGYVHRVGRTGRAGATGIGITFVGSEHARDMSKIARELRLGDQFARAGHAVEGPPRNHSHGSAGRSRRRRGRPSQQRHGSGSRA
jgi:ATP-dependent RNA helicase RhlE